MRRRDVELRHGSVAVMALVLFFAGRVVCTEEFACELNCQRNVLMDLFDDLQDSINTRNDDDLRTFYRHFCGTKYNPTSPCETCENSGSNAGLSDDRLRRLYLGVREFACDGDYRTWKGIQLAFSDRNATSCWRLITAMKSLVVPLCSKELRENIHKCAPADDVENALLALATVTARHFNCTRNVRDTYSKQKKGQILDSPRAPGGCHYRRAMNCISDFITIYTSKIATTAIKKQALKQAYLDAICQRTEGSCSAEHSVVDCTVSQRAAVERFEAGLGDSVVALCRDNAAMLKNLSKTLQCWDMLQLNDCFNPSGLLTAPALFSTRHTFKRCRDIEVKMARCVDMSLGDGCGERPDVEGVHNVLRAMLRRVDCTAAPAHSAAGLQATLLPLPVLATVLVARLP